VSDNNLLCVDGQSDVDEDGSTCDNGFWDDLIDSGNEQDLGDILLPSQMILRMTIKGLLPLSILSPPTHWLSMCRIQCITTIFSQ
jgi:hypothetical protein